MNNRTCCICGGNPDCRHDVLEPGGGLTGVTHYFCEIHGNDIEDWIAAEARKVEEERMEKYDQ